MYLQIKNLWIPKKRKKKYIFVWIYVHILYGCIYKTHTERDAVKDCTGNYVEAGTRGCHLIQNYKPECVYITALLNPSL